MSIEEKKAIIWAKRHGTFRSEIAKKAGIYSRVLTKLTKTGKLEILSRGSYRFTGSDQLSNPDFVTVAMAVPKAVICLGSALSFHRLTTQIPHEVSFALQEKSRSPRLSYPPIKVHRFRGRAYEEGIEKHMIDDVMIKIYSPEKTLSDCFKFRNKIGIDVFLEALKIYRSRKRINIELLLKYARICRVEKQIRPYLEATV